MNTINYAIDYAKINNINIDTFVSYEKMNTAFFSQSIPDKLDAFKEEWNNKKEDNWPDKREYSEWRFEFATWLDTGQVIKDEKRQSVKADELTCPEPDTAMDKLKELLKQGWIISGCYDIVPADFPNEITYNFYLVATHGDLDIVKSASHASLEMAATELYEKCMVTDEH